MLPGKTYKPEDFLRIAWTRKWFILIPTVIIAAGTFVWSYQLENRYRAQTVVLVVPQRVPEDYVRSTVTSDIAERLRTISQQILSRTRLEQLIEEFNLYPRERETMIMEDIVERMRRNDVKIDVGRGGGRGTASFSVGFESSNPRTAMQVTERLASMFVQANLQEREVLADSTNQFLQAQLEDARRRLIEHEKRLEEFRRSNAGRLPSQMNSNLQMVQTTQAQLQANAEAAVRERDRLRVLEAAVADITTAVAEAPPLVSTDGELPAGTATQQLHAATVQLRNMELRMKPDHPDIIRAKRIIAELEIKAEAEALNAAVSDSGGMPVQNRAIADRLAGLRTEAQEIMVRLETRKADDARLQGALASYTARLEAAPTLESEMTELMRDYSTIQEQYTALLRKSEESKIAVNLERRQIGEQFRVIEGARLPERPISPDRLALNLMGLAVGLGFGIALAALLAYRDTTFKTDDDVVLSLALPVVAVIPAMITTAERRRMKRRRVVLALSASVASVLLVAAVIAWRLQMLQSWVR
jgi:polysaccharide chain length determinant protein (PEP-CTERM system associated)